MIVILYRSVPSSLSIGRQNATCVTDINDFPPFYYKTIRDDETQSLTSRHDEEEKLHSTKSIIITKRAAELDQKKKNKRMR